MKSFLKWALGAGIVLAGLKLAVAEIGLSQAAQDALAASKLEQALYRLMPLPAGPVSVKRPPAEAKAELDSLLAQTQNNAELFAVRAEEEERLLDFASAEKDWKQAAALSQNKRGALESLADFYERRLSPELEVQTLLAEAALPAGNGAFKPEVEQDGWKAVQRALAVCAESRLPQATRAKVYEAWIKRYPKSSEPLHRYFIFIADAKDPAAMRPVAARIHAAFPKDLSLGLETDAELARVESGDQAALEVYDKQFSPLWPAELRTSYYSLLGEAHQLRAFLGRARSAAAANPDALDPALREFFYYEQQGKRDLADEQLLQWEGRQKRTLTADECKTLGELFLRVSDYDEAAHSYYLLYSLAGAAEADKARAIASLADLLLDVPEQSLEFGARDLSIYRNAATLDRHVGFLNSMLSLVLNTTMPEDQYQTASQASAAYFHRAMAERLIERMKTEFPRSGLAAPLEAKLLSAYEVYGQKEAIVRLAPAWLAAHKSSADYTKVALLLAETYGSTGKTAQEIALYDDLLRRLGEASGHRPLGESGDPAPAEGNEPKPKTARSPDYAHVLDLYVSRLTQLKRLNDAAGIYRKEIDRNPDDPGIYERLALFVEQNKLDSELEQTYRAAMKKFGGTSWPDKLARFYIRRKQASEYQALAKEVTDQFRGTEIESFISRAPRGLGFGEQVYREVNSYAHQRFPHNMVFVRNLLSSYQAPLSGNPEAYEKLLRENWYYDAGLRTTFFQFLSKSGKLHTELASLPKVEQAAQEKNTAALLETAEGRAWETEFESGAPAFAALAAIDPGDPGVSTRAISIERSLAVSTKGAFDSAIRLAEQRAKARPADEDAATLVGEIYSDRELYAKAAPWWNKVANMHPGVEVGYLNSATVFWDYYQFRDALRIIDSGRKTLANPALFAYESGVIHENQNDYPGAIEEYLKAFLAGKQVTQATQPVEDEGSESVDAGSTDMVEQRLVTLAKRQQTGAQIEKRSAEMAAARPLNLRVLRLRMAILENQRRREEERALLTDSLAAADAEQLNWVQSNVDRLGFDDLSVLSRQRAVELSVDPVEKLEARLQLAKYFEAHQDMTRADAEFSALLTENPNLLGIVRANVDFYWNGKQPKKAVAALEAAAGRAQMPYRDQFRREAAQKAADSADYTTARRLLDTLLSADPFNSDLLAAKAATYASEGDNNALMKFYGDQLGALKAASLSEGEKTRRADGLRRGYINALAKAKQYADALEQYQLLINAYPEDEGLTREAARFAETNRLADRLVKYYEKATADSPRNYRWPMVLARIDTSLRRYPEAVAALDKAVYVRPDRTDLFIAKADLETRLLRFDDAINTYRKLYDATYHDSQYLAMQASLEARLGHSANAVRLLKAAYVDAHPKELNGYVEAMRQLEGWRLYAEADKVFQEARPLIRANSGEGQELAEWEAKSLAMQRKPVEALEVLVEARKAGAVLKNPWELKPQMNAVGAIVDEVYTPEEKAAFEGKLESGQGIPAEINIYEMANACGFAELSAQRLMRSSRTRAQQIWPTLADLQERRLLDKELASELEAMAPAIDVSKRAGIRRAALAAYERAGDEANELRVLRELLLAGEAEASTERYAWLLVRNHEDLAARVKELSAANQKAADQLVDQLLTMVPADQGFAVVQARGATQSKLWNNAYSALTGLFFLSPQAPAAFDAALGPRTVGGQLKEAKDDSLRGEIWYYYAGRYSEYLTVKKDAAAKDLRAATVESSAAASNRYVELGEQEAEAAHFDEAIRLYGQALALTPNRVDAELLWAEAEHGQHHPAETLTHLRQGFANLAAKPGLDDFFDLAEKAFTLANRYRLTKELKPESDAVIAEDIKKNGAFEFVHIADGILAEAADRNEALDWVVKLARNPRLADVAGELLQPGHLTEAEKGPFYLVKIDLARDEVKKAVGEAAGPAEEDLRTAQLDYAKYLTEQGHADQAWQVLHQVEPKSERPAALWLELAAKTGHLAETLAQYDSETLTPPAGEEILALAATLKSLPMREWEYGRELRSGNAPATAYLGMAQVRIEQKRTDEGLALVRDVTLSVGPAFRNLQPAVELLEKAGLKDKAADYAREWRKAEPWNQEAIWAVARVSGDKALMDSVRKSEQADYVLRAVAAKGLRDAKAPVNGTQELDLLTHATVSPQEASQPLFVLARLRAKQYGEAIAINPSLAMARVALAEDAFTHQKDALGLEAWNSYATPHGRIDGLHAAPLERAMDDEPGRLERTEELAANAMAKRQDYTGARALYDKLHEQKLVAQMDAKIKLDAENRGRAPVISNELSQAGLVRPKLAGGAE